MKVHISIDGSTIEKSNEETTTFLNKTLELVIHNEYGLRITNKFNLSVGKS